MPAFTNEKAQILFALADQNGDGKISGEEVKMLFDKILLNAKIDPKNNYQGLGVEINPEHGLVV